MLTSVSTVSKSYVSVSKDNRIHLWDTETRKERRSYVEKNHLAHSYTCFDWRQSSHDNLGLFAVGCSSGNIIIWDFVRGVVVNTISHNNNNISSVAFSLDAKILFVSDDQNYVHQYRLEDKELLKSIKIGKYGVFKMVMNPKVDVLAVASSSIKLLDVNSGQKKKLDTKFPGGVTGLVYSQCGCYLVACVGDSREVFLLDIQASADSNAPLCIVSVLGTPVNITVKSTEKYIDILCWFEYTDGCIIRYDLTQSRIVPSLDNNNTNISNEDGNEDDENANCSGSSGKKKKKNKNKASADSDENGNSNGSSSFTQSQSSQIASYSITKLHTNGAIACACFGRPGNHEIDGATLIIGLSSSPSFHYITYEDQNSSSSNNSSSNIGSEGSSAAATIIPSFTLELSDSMTGANVTESASSSSSSAGSKSNKKDKEAAALLASVSVLGPHESGGKQRVLLQDDDEDDADESGKKKSSADESSTSLLSSTHDKDTSISSKLKKKKRSNSEISITDSVVSSIENDHSNTISSNKKSKKGLELTIEERLEKLSAKTTEIETQQQKTAANLKNSNAKTSSSSSSSSSSSTTAILPSSDSLVVLIEQALQASDDSLLEQCLSCQDVHVIETTTRLLPTNRAIDFLLKIIGKFEKRPSRVILLLPWLNFLLQQHASFLTGFPNFAKKFSGLSQILDQRVSCMNKFTALSGRLDLIMHQSLSVSSSSSSSTQHQQQNHQQNQQRNTSNNNNNNNHNNNNNSNNGNRGRSNSQSIEVAPLQVYNEGEDEDGDNDNEDDEEEV